MKANDVLRAYQLNVSRELAQWIDKTVEEWMPEWCKYLMNHYPESKLAKWLVTNFSGIEVRLVDAHNGSFSRTYQVCSWGMIVAQLEVE